MNEKLKAIQLGRKNKMGKINDKQKKEITNKTKFNNKPTKKEKKKGKNYIYKRKTKIETTCRETKR